MHSPPNNVLQSWINCTIVSFPGHSQTLHARKAGGPATALGDSNTCVNSLCGIWSSQFFNVTRWKTGEPILIQHNYFTCVYILHVHCTYLMHLCVPLSSPGTPDAAAAADKADHHHKQEAYNGNNDDDSQGIYWRNKYKYLISNIPTWCTSKHVHCM